jgi:glycosyltransferase involved in cell wall biosynthesis
MVVEISVVIPAFNAQDTIGEQLEALAAQEFAGSWEVVVADNGSTDDTVARALEHAASLPDLRVVDASQHRGASHARNVGAEAAKAPFLIFLDADDAAQPGWLATMAEASRTADLIAGHTVLILRDAVAGDQVTTHSAPTAWSRVLPSEGFLDANPAANLGVRRSVWSDVGGFRTNMLAGEDTAFCWDVQLAGHPLVRVPDAVVFYRSRADISGFARQQFTWGVGVVQLYVAFREHGAPRSSAIGALARWAILIVSSPAALFSADSRRRWVGRISRRAGRAVGSIRYRALCL